MPASRPLRERFEEKTQRAPNGCLLWTGSTDDCGYGMLRLTRGPVRRAHIVAWFLATGAWPTLCVLHTCDTPGCVEHAHHFEGTRAANNADRDAKGRHVALCGENHGNAKLSARQVSEIRRRLAGAGRGMGRNLAWEYGVSEYCISAIRVGRSWAGENGSQY